MRIQIIDTQVPEGYTYIRTDQFTKSEFIAEFRKDQRGEAKKWTDEHPKGVYTLEDVHEFRNATSPAFRHLCGRTGSPVYGIYHGVQSPFVGRTSKRYDFDEDENR